MKKMNVYEGGTLVFTRTSKNKFTVAPKPSFPCDWQASDVFKLSVGDTITVMLPPMIIEDENS